MNCVRSGTWTVAVNRQHRRFRLFSETDGENGWDVRRASDRGQRDPALDIPKTWHVQVCDASDGDELWYNSEERKAVVNLQNFRNNISKAASKYLIGPVGQMYNNDAPPPPPPQSQGNIIGATRPTGQNRHSNDTRGATTSGVARLVTGDGDLGSGSKVSNLSILYVQCQYETSTSMKGARGLSTPKTSIIIQAISGWYLEMEKGKGDFFQLADDGKTLRMSITSSNRLFQPKVASDLLVSSGIFGGIYNPPSGATQHPAVTSLQKSIGELLDEGKPPARVLEIPLQRKCTRVCAIEGINHKQRTGTGGTVLVPFNSPVPQALYYVPAGKQQSHYTDSC